MSEKGDGSSGGHQSKRVKASVSTGEGADDDEEDAMDEDVRVSDNASAEKTKDVGQYKDGAVGKERGTQGAFCGTKTLQHFYNAVCVPQPKGYIPLCAASPESHDRAAKGFELVDDHGSYLRRRPQYTLHSVHCDAVGHGLMFADCRQMLKCSTGKKKTAGEEGCFVQALRESSRKHAILGHYTQHVPGGQAGATFAWKGKVVVGVGYRDEKNAKQLEEGEVHWEALRKVVDKPLQITLATALEMLNSAHIPFKDGLGCGPKKFNPAYAKVVEMEEGRPDAELGALVIAKRYAFECAADKRTQKQIKLAQRMIEDQEIRAWAELVIELVDHALTYKEVTARYRLVQGSLSIMKVFQRYAEDTAKDAAKTAQREEAERSAASS
jgi:hypothetical protein